MNTWIISDTHFGHSNIISYCNRPFKNADHMNTVMRERWCNRVKPEDLVYHLGDVMLLARQEDSGIRAFITTLPGKKILIRGNHDKSCTRMMELGFDYACESAIIAVPGFSGVHVMLNHKPLRTLPSAWHMDTLGVDWILHGHIHNSTPEQRSLHVAKGELRDIPYFNINCSVEVRNYEPQTIQHILRKHIYEVKQSGRQLNRA